MKQILLGLTRDQDARYGGGRNLGATGIEDLWARSLNGGRIWVRADRRFAKIASIVVYEVNADFLSQLGGRNFVVSF